ncbi:MAG: hypothetical protein HS128_23075 [Ideonella sp.]|nr:hypothetical protein [Ideonella sp.]MCC7457266.1 hypothetical protein [Nitrospira sp.]
MTRLLLWVAIAGVVVWWLVRTRQRASGQRRTPAQAPSLTVCAHCGVHLPVGDAIVDGQSRYCSEAHRLAGPRQDA